MSLFNTLSDRRGGGSSSLGSYYDRKPSGDPRRQINPLSFNGTRGDSRGRGRVPSTTIGEFTGSKPSTLPPWRIRGSGPATGGNDPGVTNDILSLPNDAWPDWFDIGGRPYRGPFVIGSPHDGPVARQDLLRELYGMGTDMADQAGFENRLHPENLMRLAQQRREDQVENYGQGLMSDLEFSRKQQEGALKQSLMDRGMGNTTETDRQFRLQDSNYQRQRTAVENQILQARLGVYNNDLAGTLLNDRRFKGGLRAATDAGIYSAIGSIGGGMMGMMGGGG